MFCFLVVIRMLFKGYKNVAENIRQVDVLFSLNIMRKQIKYE